MMEYMHKYQEALQSLQKKVGLVDEMQQENLKIHQLNLTLTGELEDYRHQTKRLLTDLRQKEEEIATLKLSRNQFGSSDRSQLELESMRQKCDAWREEVEKLSPLRDEVAQLHQENARLKQELALVSEDNTGLARQLQEMSGASGRVGGLERKASEYDQLMERVTELQQVRVQLENELTPLRAERANILSENAALREGSQPEKYLQLKSNFAKLSEECVQLQKCLTDESTESERLRKRLAEESAINRRMEEANRQLQQQLEEATDEKGLQAIRERMERYKQERDMLRLTVAQLQNELQVHRVKEQENQKDTVVGLHSPQEQEGVWEKQLDQLVHQLEESNKRMHRYREERNTARILNKSLEEQINTLQSTVQQLQSSRAYDSLASAAFDASMVSQLQLQDNSPLQRDLSPSPHEEQVEPYSPDAYSDPPSAMHSRSGSAARKPVKQVSAGGTSSGVNYKQRFASASTSSSSVSPRGQVYADVTMKDGIARNILIEKPLYKLNARQKPEVIVKRKAGSYEMGVLSYLGVLDGKEMAGVTLHFPDGNNDGAFKDGKYHFRCTPNHGIYCPLSNIFVEATV
jgi:chromosome segregation ATPase